MHSMHSSKAEPNESCTAALATIASEQANWSVQATHSINKRTAQHAANQAGPTASCLKQVQLADARPRLIPWPGHLPGAPGVHSGRVLCLRVSL